MPASCGGALRSEFSTPSDLINFFVRDPRPFHVHSLWETTQTLFWAVFGLVDLDSFELDGIKIFTRFWGMLMFGCYSVINIVVLLNLLIAMMNHSYQLISVRLRTSSS
jgi:Ion transport protein